MPSEIYSRMFRGHDERGFIAIGELNAVEAICPYLMRQLFLVHSVKPSFLKNLPYRSGRIPLNLQFTASSRHLLDEL